MGVCDNKPSTLCCRKRHRSLPPQPHKGFLCFLYCAAEIARLCPAVRDTPLSWPRPSLPLSCRPKAPAANPCLESASSATGDRVLRLQRLACGAAYASTPNSIKKSQDFLLALQSVLSPKIEKELTIVRGFARTCWCAPRAASLPCVAAAVCHLKLIASRAQAAPRMLPVRCFLAAFFSPGACRERACKCFQRLSAAVAAELPASRDSSLPSCSNKIKRMRLFQFPMHVSLG